MILLKRLSTTILLLTLLLSDYVAQGQESMFNSPDYKKIEAQIADTASKFYYPRLMDRYEYADNKMSLEEKRCLYYGYTLHKNYAPYKQSKYLDSLYKLPKQQNYSKKMLNKILLYADSALAKDPFDLTALLYQEKIYRQLHRPRKSYICGFRIKLIQEVLMSSGNGQSKENAIHVISVPHEYDFMRLMGLRVTGKKNSQDQPFDYLYVAPNDIDAEGFYFNVSVFKKLLYRK
ncbi:MAG: DUF4919 domain-containing protein [Bacteroidia bacterium]|nr:DUF4919 domain-containing protein [Bacteroidia bacterium]